MDRKSKLESIKKLSDDICAVDIDRADMGLHSLWLELCPPLGRWSQHARDGAFFLLDLTVWMLALPAPVGAVVQRLAGVLDEAVVWCLEK
jgi:hypothetical protein